ncbi:glycosyltransferase [Aeromonas piscicola]|uniref:Glycosyltransferase n=1 Tax=Aeromonas piscicola TaxID=600645 RepID=A0ABT7Q7J8_9GAMM|nr:glycosyltransferase [Aeromonas piscicola]MDM5129728.1 glycosyltransferase [Aeromonas piscicola]
MKAINGMRCYQGKDSMRKRIIIFGLGSLYKRAIIYIKNLYEIVALTDNNQSLHGAIVDGILVIPPSEISLKKCDGIIVLSSFYKEIHKQLISFGVDGALINNGLDILVDVFRPLLENALINKCENMNGTENNVSFFIDTLGNGGAEKALVDLTKMLSNENISASIVVTFNIGDYFSSVPRRFPIRILFDYNDKGLIDLAFTLVEWKTIRKIIKIPDSQIEVSFLDGFSSYLVVAGRTDKKIGWVHSDLSYYLDNEQKRKEASAIYSLFTDVVFVTRNSRVAWETLFPENLHVKKHVIYNLVSVQNITAHKGNSNLIFDKLTFIAVGRLDYVKGFDLLIEICHRLNGEGYDNYQLLIIGEGCDRPDLMKEIEELHIPNISLLGHLAYPYQYIDAADFVISSSRSEGFSLVILEALLLGTPVIATKTAGSMELIARLGGGVLVDNNIEAIYSAMKSACEGELNSLPPARECFEDIYRDTCDAIIGILGGGKDVF